MIHAIELVALTPELQSAADGPSGLFAPLIVGAIVCVLIAVAAMAFFRVRAMRKLGQQSVLSDHVFAAFLATQTSASLSSMSTVPSCGRTPFSRR